MEERNYFANSNWWLGVQVVSLLVLVAVFCLVICAIAAKGNTGLKGEDVTGLYLTITGIFFAIAVVDVIFAFSARKEAERLSRPDAWMKEQDEYQNRAMLEGKPEHILPLLIFSDQLEFAVRLEDPEDSRIFFGMYAPHCSDSDILHMFWLASEIGNLVVLYDIVESGRVLDFNARTGVKDNTAAHIAAIFSQVDVLDYFKTLHAGGRMNLLLRNKDGQTPFDLLDQRQKRMVELLSDIQLDPTDNAREGDVVEREGSGEVKVEHTDGEAVSDEKDVPLVSDDEAEAEQSVESGTDAEEKPEDKEQGKDQIE